MLYYILYSLTDFFSFFNVSKYITFRAVMSIFSAFTISFLLSPWLIKKLKQKNIKQQIRDDGPSFHLNKKDIPTMGGFVFIIAVVFTTILWMDLYNLKLWIILFITSGFGLVGFIDDFLKINKKNSNGLNAKKKIFMQILIASLAMIITFYIYDKDGRILFPFFKNLSIDLGYFYIPWAVFVIVGSSNAVNLTDGLDGLATGSVITSAACFGIISYVAGNFLIAKYLHYPYFAGSGEFSIFAAAIVGAGLGFLWYNAYPAQVFMGDIGSLSLGGALGALAVFTKSEILFTIMGGIFVLETLSVITQVFYFKLKNKRIFLMAPIHHHFELKGWPEPKIIVRFWIISILLAILSLVSLKLR